MITEDYVSFEVAKLLKDKGFEGFTMFSYSTKGATMCGHWENETDWLPKCTLQMAMKWLREVKGLYIDIITLSPLEFNFSIVVVTPERTYLDNACEGGECYLNHQDACEAAIKYCLENLI